MVSLASGFFGPVAPAGPAANPDDYPLGSWSGGTFKFRSPEAEGQWRRDAVDSGVHFQAWNQGRKLNEKARQLAELGFASSADIYRGPDGDYYQTTPASREDPRVTAMRNSALKRDKARDDLDEMTKRANARIVPQALAYMAQQVPIAKPMPATSTPPPVANDNAPVANDNRPSIASVPVSSSPANSAAAGETKRETQSGIPAWSAQQWAELENNVKKYEADNPPLTRFGQRLKAGKLDLASSAANAIVPFLESTRQSVTPYLDRIDQGEPLAKILPRLADGAVDPALKLTPRDLDFIAQYYGSPDERDDMRSSLSGAIGGQLTDAITDRQQSAAIPRHPAVAAFGQALAEKRYADAAKILATYPVGVAAQTAVEGIPGTLPVVAAGMVDPALAVPALVGTGVTEAYGAAVLDYLGEHGIDTTDAAQIRKALSDPATLAAVKSHAAAKAAESLGINIALGSVSQVGSKIVSRYLGNAAKTNELGASTAAATGSTVNETVPAEEAKTNLSAKQTLPTAEVAGPKLAPRTPHEWDSYIFEAQKNFYTEGQARKLLGDDLGLAYIYEKLRGTEKSIQFHAESPGAIFPERKFVLAPAILFRNPNTRGLHFIKLDSVWGATTDGFNLVLADQKTKLPFFNNTAMKEKAETLDRLRTALKQNPQFKVIYEFPDQDAADNATLFLIENGYEDIVNVKVRQEP